MLYDMKDNLDSHASNNTSALKKWLILNGRDSIAKFKEFESSGFNKCLTFSEGNPNEFKAFIDPENQFSTRDKFSMVIFTILSNFRLFLNINFFRLIL